jgi:hypothetical protein
MLRYKKHLEKYTWGLGLEHEMQIYHEPKENQKNIKEYRMFDSFSVVNRILEEKQNSKLDISIDDFKFLHDLINRI